MADWRRETADRSRGIPSSFRSRRALLPSSVCGLPSPEVVGMVEFCLRVSPSPRLGVFPLSPPLRVRFSRAVVTTQCLRAFLDFLVVTNVAFVTTAYTDFVQCLQGLSRCHDLAESSLNYSPSFSFSASPRLRVSASSPPFPRQGRISGATVQQPV